MAVNGIALSAGTMVRLGLGFLTWLVAARLYSTSQVGLAAAAISAMFLCLQIGTLGIDLALIALFPQHRGKPSVLLETAITLGVLTAVGSGFCFIGLSAAGLHSLRVIAASPAYGAVFLLLTALGAAWWIMDQASVAARRSDQVLKRASLAAATTLSGVACFGILGWRSAAAILTAWVLAAAAAFAMGLIQLSSVTEARHRFRPRLAERLARRLLAVGLPNYAMTAADNAPGLVLPIVAAQALSTRAAAFWYVVWMMAQAAYTIPFAFGVNLFAAATAAPLELARHVREAFRVGIPLAAAATIALAGLGPYVLSILGHSYASAGSTPARIVAMAAVPMVVIKVYLAVCRSTGRMLEGTLVVGTLGTIAVGLAVAAAGKWGLSGIAAAWLTVQVVAALATGIRLRVLLASASRSERWQGSEAAALP